MRWRTAFTVLLVALLAAPVVAAEWFTDIPQNHPRREAIRYAWEEGLFEGFEDGGFRPDAELTEGQFERVVRRLHEKRSELTRGEWARIIHEGLPALPSGAGIATTTTTTALLEAPSTTVREAPSTTFNSVGNELPPTVAVPSTTQTDEFRITESSTTTTTRPVPPPFHMDMGWRTTETGDWGVWWKLNRNASVTWDISYVDSAGIPRFGAIGYSQNRTGGIGVDSVPSDAALAEVRVITKGATGFAVWNPMTGDRSWEVRINGGKVFRSEAPPATIVPWITVSTIGEPPPTLPPPSLDNIVWEWQTRHRGFVEVRWSGDPRLRWTCEVVARVRGSDGVSRQMPSSWFRGQEECGSGETPGEGVLRAEVPDNAAYVSAVVTYKDEDDQRRSGYRAVTWNLEKHTIGSFGKDIPLTTVPVEEV